MKRARATIVVSEVMKKYPESKAKSREKLNSEEMGVAKKVARAR